MLYLPNRRAVVATLIATEGATPKEAGSKMWVDETGAIIGSVTIGGCVDARVIEEATAVLTTGRSSLVSMALGDEDAWALGMTCAGTIEVLIEPYNPALRSDSLALAHKVVERAIADGGRALIISRLDGHRDRLVVFLNGQRAGTLGDPDLDRAATLAAPERFAAAVSGSVVLQGSHGDVRLYFEHHAPPLSLIVFGATHVAVPLVDMGHTAGLRTVVVDGRDRFATRERFPNADEILVGMPSEVAERMKLSASSLVVLLSHDYKYDLPVLRTVLTSDAAYVGCLGGVKRGRAMLEFLLEQGVPPDRLARVRIPVGLDIGAKSPAEIAVSVLAEAIAVQRGRSGGAMRDRKRSETPTTAQ